MIERNGSQYRVSVPMLIVNARALLEAGRALLRSESETSVELDLAAVQEVDSSALAVVFGLRRSAGVREIGLRVLNPPESLLSLAELYGVSVASPRA